MPAEAHSRIETAKRGIGPRRTAQHGIFARDEPAACLLRRRQQLRRDVARADVFGKRRGNVSGDVEWAGVGESRAP
jgi:hypothetical protein